MRISGFDNTHLRHVHTCHPDASRPALCSREPIPFNEHLEQVNREERLDRYDIATERDRPVGSPPAAPVPPIPDLRMREPVRADAPRLADLPPREEETIHREIAVRYRVTTSPSVGITIDVFV